MATLGDEYFLFYTIYCEYDNNRSEYKATTYQDKIAIITKADTESGQGSAEQVIAQLRDGLSGSRDSIHKAISILGSDVFVTYGDEGTMRTIVVANNPSIAGGVDEVPVYVGYLDLSLWRLYSKTVEAQIKAMSEKKQRGAEKIQKEL